MFFNNLKKQIEKETGVSPITVPVTHQHPPIKAPKSVSLTQTTQSGPEQFAVNSNTEQSHLRLEHSELESRYRSLETAYEGYRAKTADLLNKKDAHISRLQERVVQLEGTVEEMQEGKKLHSVLVDRDLLQQKLNTLGSAYEEEKLSWDAKVKELQKTILDQKDHLEKTITDLAASYDLERKKCRCKELTEETCVMKEKIASLERTLTDKDTEVNLLLGKLNAVTLERDDFLRNYKDIAHNHRRSSEQKFAENMHLRKELGETQEYFEAMDIQSEQHITTLANQIEDLHTALDDTHRDLNVMNQELEEKNQAIDQLQQRINTLEGNGERQQDVIEGLKEEGDRQKDRVREAIKERDDLLLRNASLSHEVEIVRRDAGREREEIRAQLTHLSGEVDSYKKKLGDLEGSQETALALTQLNEKVSELEDALKDRDTTIRLQQQRLADMKKTLQKELKLNPQTGTSQQLAIPEAGSLGRMSPFLSRSKGNLVAASNPNLSLADSDDTEIAGVNFQYLKHVVLRFVTGNDNEALQLVRAVATLLRFTPEEEKLVWDTLRWKTSWLPASKPRLSLNFSRH